MVNKEAGSLSLWFFEHFLKYQGLIHFISERRGGLSEPPFHSLNLSFDVGDDPKKVIENRKILASTLNFKIKDIVTCEQIHKGKVAVIKRKEKIEQGCVVKECDALLTDVSGVCLMVLVADCLPLLFYDPQKKVIGVAHAGWRGTVYKIAENTVKTMKRVYGSNVKEIIVGLGPSIGPCCYEVRSDVVEKFQKELGNSEGIVERRDKKYYLNLWQANKIQLLRSGILEKNIETSGICSKCHNDVFFSVRANKKTGRFAAGIMKTS